MLDKIYHKILWLAGEPTCPEEVAPDGEHFSDKLARQHERLGRWWWCGLGVICVLILISLMLFGWLVHHILDYKEKRKEKFK